MFPSNRRCEEHRQQTALTCYLVPIVAHVPQPVSDGPQRRVRCDRSGKGASKPPQNSQAGPEIDRWDPGGRRASIGLYLRLRHLPCMESQGIQEARQETAAGHAGGRVLPTAIAPVMKGTPQEIAVRATSLRSGLRCHNSLSFTPDGTPRVEIEDEPHSRPAAGRANNRIATLSSPSSFDD